MISSASQRQKVVFAHFASEQIQPVALSEQNCGIINLVL